MKKLLIISILLMSSLAWAGSTTVVVGQPSGALVCSFTDFTSDENICGAWLFENNLNDETSSSNTLTHASPSYSTDTNKIQGTYGLTRAASPGAYRTDTNLSSGFPGKYITGTNTTYSMGGWIKFSSVGSFGLPLIGKYHPAYTTLSYFLYVNTSSKACFNLYASNGSTYTAYAGNTTLSTNTWYFIAVTCDNTNIRIYVGTETVAPWLDMTPTARAYTLNGLSSTDLIVASSYDGGFYADEVWIFKDCLTSDEISQIWCGGIDGTSSR